MKKIRVFLLSICIFLLVLFIVLFGLEKNKMNYTEEQIANLVEQRTDLLNSIEGRLRKGTDPIYQMYAEISYVFGMDRVISLDQNNNYKFISYSKSLIQYLHNNLNMFAGNNYGTREDRIFLADQVKTVLEAIQKDNFNKGYKSQILINELTKETNKYLESR
ncbi:hypothetical protein [Paenibacillus faecalis]|uniref:hypothetical protein n=1 Tax=Paenibacillus faecalis TaxID=2079532 RepID=UPI000D0E8A21|nr:hypothetical protein [Paenibacillus faecalis]